MDGPAPERRAEEPDARLARLSLDHVDPVVGLGEMEAHEGQHPKPEPGVDERDHAEQGELLAVDFEGREW